MEHHKTFKLPAKFRHDSVFFLLGKFLSESKHVQIAFNFCKGAQAHNFLEFYTCSVFWPFFSVEFLVELDVTSTGLFSICAWFLFPVLLCWGEFCCVVLRCVVIHYVVLRCVVLRSVVLCVLLRCVALCCDPLCRCCVVSVELRCVVLRCDPWHNTCCVALCCVVLLTSSAFLVFRPC